MNTIARQTRGPAPWDRIGIVACSAEGAALCYRTICAEGAVRCGPHYHPEISMHTQALAEYERRIERDDWAGVGDLMLSSAAKLAARGIECLRPDDADRRQISRIIMDELVYGNFRSESITCFQGVIGRLKASGCDAVVLGCTEIPLIIGDANSPLPTLDSTRLLAVAALERALEGSARGGSHA
jgi:aspartate/glutamate racemase